MVEETTPLKQLNTTQWHWSSSRTMQVSMPGLNNSLLCLFCSHCVLGCAEQWSYQAGLPLQVVFCNGCCQGKNTINSISIIKIRVNLRRGTEVSLSWLLHFLVLNVYECSEPVCTYLAGRCFCDFIIFNVHYVFSIVKLFNNECNIFNYRKLCRNSAVCCDGILK